MFPFYAQGAAQSIEDAAVLAACLASGPYDSERALRRYEALRIGRTTRLQEESRRRERINHLPDGPEQQARDAAMQNSDPLVRSGWIYGYDAEAAVRGAAV
jgi:salicylate hydroxylase